MVSFFNKYTMTMLDLYTVSDIINSHMAIEDLPHQPEKANPQPVRSDEVVQALVKWLNRLSESTEKDRKDLVYKQLEFPAKEGSTKYIQRQREIGRIGAQQDVVDILHSLLQGEIPADDNNEKPEKTS